MEYAKLETAALAHVDDSYYYGAYCRKCKHSARLSLEKLRNLRIPTMAGRHSG